MKFLFPHAAITHDVTVRVSVNYMPEQSRPEIGKWFWVYHIRIENGSEETIVDGEGVVGEQPTLVPGQSHDYVSGCPLETPHGSMEGFYSFRRADGSPMEVRIPFFPLAAPATTH